MGIINIVKMAIPLKNNYKPKAISIIVMAAFFTETKKTRKFTMKHKRPPYAA